MGIYSHNFEMRRSYRSELELWASLRCQGHTTRHKVLISELSISGCRIKPDVRLSADDHIFIEMSGYATIRARIVWSSHDRGEYGCRFEQSLAQAVVDRMASSCWDAEPATIDPLRMSRAVKLKSGLTPARRNFRLEWLTQSQESQLSG